MASQGEGKKRRSFLPSFRKSQPAPQAAAPVQPSPDSPIQSSVSLLTSSPVIRLPPQPTSSVPPPAPYYSPAPAYCPSPQIYSPAPPTYSAAPQVYSPAPPTYSPAPPTYNPAPPSYSVSQTAKTDSAPGHRKEKESTDGPSFGVGLRVGARVKIGGVKPGILRYLGTTHLAPGIFCGIELFDPDGNHDGEVNGHRYFNCRPNHGIFAPKEKVCLDTSGGGGLNRIASGSDGSYSSTESLSERTNKAFRCFEEGELEAVDCTKPSPITSPQEADLRFDGDQPLYYRTVKHHKKNKLYYGLADPNLSPESLDYSDIPQKKAKSGLPVPKSGLPTVSAPQSKLPTFSRTQKYEDSAGGYKRVPSVPSQPPTTSVTSYHTGDQEPEIYKTASARLSEDSEDDGFPRDTLSRDIKKQLRADSRQYLNFTFDPEEEMSHSMDQEDGEESDDLASTPWYRGSHARHERSDESSAGSEEASLSSSSQPGAENATFRYQDTMIVDQVSCVTYSNAGEMYKQSRGQAGLSVSDSDIASSDMMEANDDDDDHGGGGGLRELKAAAHYDEDLIASGGYGSSVSGGGCSGGLSRPLDSLTSQSSRAPQPPPPPPPPPPHSGAPSEAHGHVTAGAQPETDNKRDYSKVEKSYAYSAQSHSDSATSSPSKKYRKISTDSFNNEGGDSSSSGTEPKTDSSGEARGENLEDSSTGASPEVSQALEWDYGQEFDGKIPMSQQDSTMTTSASTGTSESLSDVLRDVSEHSDGAIEPEMPSSVIDDSEMFETPDNDFENIDSLEDFPIFGKDSKSLLTDSGISDKSFDMSASKASTVCGNSSDDCSREDDASSHTTTRAVSSDSSQETLAAEYVADTPVSVEDKDFLADEICPTQQSAAADCFGDLRREDNSFGDGNSNSPASVMSLEDVSVLQDKTIIGDDVATGSDLDLPHSPTQRPPGCDEDGGKSSRKDRPISLISTTSADTGYVPDTDSELGTLTSNSPNVDWLDKKCGTHPVSYAPMDELFDEGVNNMDISIEDKTFTGCDAKAMSMDHLKTTDDEDYNSDLTTNTEDERTEADQVYGLSRDNSLSQGSVSPKLPHPDDVRDQNQPGEDTSDMIVPDDNNMNVECVPEENNRENEGKKGDQSKTKPKKTLTLTKKRSENVDHKLPNINVTSRLADYIKAPLPVKVKEEKENKKVKNKANNKKANVTDVENKVAKVDSRHSSPEREPVVISKPKPIIKHAPPKSKWGNIMSQIEATKDTVKPKPKSEIKSSLAAYISAPLPQLPADQTPGTKSDQLQGTSVKKKEFVKRIKNLPPPPPKIDLSKVKSKLNVPTASSAIKAAPKRDKSPSSKARDTSPGGHVSRKDLMSKRLSDANIVLERQDMSGNVSSVRSSHTDISTNMDVDISTEEVFSKQSSINPATTSGDDHRLSVSSMKSVQSEALKNKVNEMKTLQDGRARANVRSHTPVKLPSRAAEVRDANAMSPSPNRSSSSPVILKPIKPKSKAGVRPDDVKPGGGARAPPPASAVAKGRDSSANQGKKSKAIGSTRSSVSSAAVSTNAANKSQKEIIRLESLCESRTKELIQTKMQLKAAANGFDAMAIVVNYCCNELNAFDCPFLVQRLEKLKGKLAEHLSQINELNSERDRLNQSLAQAIQEKEVASKQIQEALTQVNLEREEHVRITHEMDDTHNASLTAQRDELTKKHEEALQKYVQYYDKQLDLMKHAHERQLSEMKNENKLEMNGLKIAHLEEIQVLRNKHDSQMEDLHQQHRNKLEDITHRFESIKLTLSDKVESLRGECEELRHRARSSEEALQRDADVKVQIALAPYMSLPKEIESLKTVLEMRNEEIQKLRSKNTDQEKQLEELPIAKEKIISLQQKVENLQAIINIKSDHEKQLHEHCQILMRKYDRASRANKRLSMDYEQVMWRMSQSSEFGSSESLTTQRQLSKSPPPRSDHGSPEGRHRNVSPNISGEVVMRKKRNSHSVGDGDRKLRSRSATFVVEKTEEGEIPSPSSSPQPKLKRWRKKPDTDESKLLKVDRRFERMCRSAGSEILVDSSHQENESESGENVLLSDATDSMTSSVEMGESYSHSISGVSDSGVYDSMTRSDMLNSSVISSDPEWVNSGNNSFILDNSTDEFSLQTGDFGSLNDSLLRNSATGKSFMKASNTVVFCPTTKEASGDDVLESLGVEDVFDDVMSMDSSICSIDNVDVTVNEKQNA